MRLQSFRLPSQCQRASPLTMVCFTPGLPSLYWTLGLLELPMSTVPTTNCYRCVQRENSARSSQNPKNDERQTRANQVPESLTLPCVQDRSCRCPKDRPPALAESPKAARDERTLEGVYTREGLSVRNQSPMLYCVTLKQCFLMPIPL